jgi:hypothetical protein
MKPGTTLYVLGIITGLMSIATLLQEGDWQVRVIVATISLIVSAGCLIFGYHLRTAHNTLNDHLRKEAPAFEHYAATGQIKKKKVR